VQSDLTETLRDEIVLWAFRKRTFTMPEQMSLLSKPKQDWSLVAFGAQMSGMQLPAGLGVWPGAQLFGGGTIRPRVVNV
jgi:hypothetical protein